MAGIAAAQRGNRRQTVFFAGTDCAFYLDSPRHYTARYAARIVDGCLMGNHVHMVAMPTDLNGLAKAAGGTHNGYARWQNRFYACSLVERIREATRTDCPAAGCAHRGQGGKEELSAIRRNWNGGLRSLSPK